ncbi:GNAT family N-acetyltransferase [Afifella sp. JA880]|uniref:GNAT family N-acetyltransferase n=1 Tax=Afifella sp. JA880 TaxID=2975280 RepID=UPI0021BB1129|nr:GNAT family N-acetyltransferase [Afifella sp. JA880]MCT8268190.1 GNAT family N-acetyltransferase [Afifella sp. JA880]
MQPIETDRLILRRFEKRDAPGLFAYLQEPAVSCFFSMRLADLAAAEDEVKKRAESDSNVAVCLRDTGEMIGDLFAVLEGDDTYALGWNFNKAFSGAGYATEAARALFAHLFTKKGARRLYAYVEDTNYPSQHLCERLGMRREGLFIEYVSFMKDEAGNPIFENTMQYAILRKEWESRAEL